MGRLHSLRNGNRSSFFDTNCSPNQSNNTHLARNPLLLLEDCELVETMSDIACGNATTVFSILEPQAISRQY